MHKTVWNFLRRPAGEKRLALEALWYLALIKTRLKTSSFNSLARHYGLETVESVQHGADSDIEMLKSIRWAIGRVSRSVPWSSVCLDQALAAQRMLSRRKIPGNLYLGVAKKEDAGLKAHAWVRCNGEFVTGRAGHEAFTVVSCFSW
ncbi:MAG: lasso peptide biosynthesis B2 protein [Sulfurovum sp.]|nr:lasso peptide biosynthesis B2 protein [Sulfurovum sp.]